MQYRWSTKELQFQNDTENRGVLCTLRLHQLTEKPSRFCTNLAETRYILRRRHDGCRDDNPTRPTHLV